MLYASGVIASGRSTQDSVNGAVVGSDTMVEQLERIRDDDSIKAIVLRVDSPGGSSVASDVIWRELSITRDQKPSRPLIASMSDLAASGGYYISMPAQVIVAQPGTLTGSIGIFGGKVVDRRHARKDRHRHRNGAVGPQRDAVVAVRSVHARAARRSCMAYMQSFYDGFVAQGGGVAPHDAGTDSRRGAGTRLDRPQARERGLVDELGGLDRAVAIAKARAGIPADEEVELVTFPPRRTLYEAIAEQFGSSSGVGVVGVAGRSGGTGDGRAHRAGPALPARRAAGADAVCVREIEPEA